jgi:transposase
MIILAIDLGKFSSTACVYDTVKGEHRFEKAPTRPAVISELISGSGADRVVIEVGSQAGWMSDICEALSLPVQVANPNHEGWRWKTVKRKTDRGDALKLARLSVMGQVPCVTLPRTRVLAKPLEEAGREDLWRAQLHLELLALDQVEALHDQVERKLNALAQDDERVARLRTIPGVGPRLAETVVALIDDPKRFKSGKQVGAYAGLVPAQFESGMSKRQGRITGRGSTLLRALLVEVAWLMRRYNPHFRGVFAQVCRGSPSRRKIAVVAVARRLLVTCWAMMRDGTVWKSPAPPQAEVCVA